RIEMPTDCNAFDFNTVTDVIIKLNYTAREGGDLLRKKARKEAELPERTAQRSGAEMHAPADQADQENLMRLFSSKHEFPNEWYQFSNAATSQPLELKLTKERFPFPLRGRTITIEKLDVYLIPKSGDEEWVKKWGGKMA